VPGAVRAGVGGEPAPLRTPLPQRLPGHVAPLRPRNLSALPRPAPPPGRRASPAGTFVHGGLLATETEIHPSVRPSRAPAVCCNVMCGLPCERSRLGIRSAGFALSPLSPPLGTWSCTPCGVAVACKYSQQRGRRSAPTGVALFLRARSCTWLPNKRISCSCFFCSFFFV
jgi:hypothetical protein